MSQPIVCSRCGTMLRKRGGLHSAHEPPRSVDERGPLIRCPQCGEKYRYPADDDNATVPKREAGSSGA